MLVFLQLKLVCNYIFQRLPSYFCHAGKNNPCVRCVMMELTSSPLTEASEDVVCSSNPVQTFSAGPTCKLLTKNAIFQSPEEDGNVFVCAGDEASNSALVSLVPFRVVEGFIAALRRGALSVCFGLVTRVTLCRLVCCACCSRCNGVIVWFTQCQLRPVVHFHREERRQ